MPKCPKCNDDITYLQVISECMQTFELTENKDFPIYSGVEWIEGEGIFQCPYCDEVLFKTEQEAINFLAGDTNVNE